MALPPKFKGHRLVFTDASTAAASPEPLYTLEFYLDYVCPYSAKFFRTLYTSVIPHIRADPTLSSRLQLIFRQQIQPWHPSSTLAHEAALAVQRVTGGDPSKFWAFSSALFAAQTSFFDEAVAGETRNETYRRLARLAAQAVEGLGGERDRGGEEEVYKLLEIPTAGPGEECKNAGNGVTRDVALMTKMARLVGVHVTPTVVFDGVVAGQFDSSWTGEQWKDWLEKNIV